MKQKILITGINKGLGLAMTKLFLSKGHEVFALVRHYSDDLKSLHKKYISQLNLYTADVSEEAQVENALTSIKKDTDSIDMLINNSAVYYHSDKVPVEKIDFSIYVTTYRVNAIGPLLVIKYALPLVRRGSRKQIINISSEAGSIADTWRKSEYAYCMSKAALNMASRILKNDVQAEGINVLTVHPGWFSSEMGTKEAPITPDQAAIKIVKLLEKSFNIKSPMYIDPDGKEIRW
jgi:NAD(P)-dependent dehydrogenase (short-subunit alcohol dehydrogenase family)